MLEDKDLVSIQEVRTKVEKAYAAWRKFRAFSQEQVDAIVERMAAAGRASAEKLAALAVEETGYGNVKDKIAKNLLNADLLPRKMRGMRTIGLIREIPEERLVEYAVPVGVVAAILPTTNPTSTAIYKILISLKSGNAVVLSPHPRAVRCTCATADLLYRAALEAGAPEDIIQCLGYASIDGTNALMRHERTGVILSTGGHGIVRAAYSSGKPAFGVGPGNVPVMIERTADVPDAIAKVIEGKSFDYGTVCSSEQAIVVEDVLKDTVLAALKAGRAYFCNAEQRQALARLLVTPNWTINPACVGQSPTKIAGMAGFTVPSDTSILVAELEGVGKQHPLSMEKLSPVLALYWVKDFAAGMGICESLLRFGGLGHTCAIYSRDDARIRQYAARMPANRVLVNTPAPQGSTGITTNVFPSMTLGCGAAAGNITSDNVGPQHLFNIKRLAYAVRTAAEAFGTNATLPAPVASTAPSGAAVDIVDRFLARRAGAGRPAPKSQAPAHASCACQPEPEAPKSDAPPPSAPARPQIADFVCEEDVRTAIRQSRRIYIGPKTIVTPSARDLAAPGDILVLA
ncbi:MAG TPA: aldehyde dehydrogenase family protein [Bryobacteraceae bacterium]|nr:aldehyde dehydrogenase family protein [Bryobacteraceae bacterium]